MSLLCRLSDLLKPWRGAALLAAPWLVSALTLFIGLQWWLPVPDRDWAFDRYVGDAEFLWFWGIAAVATIALATRAVSQGRDSQLPLIPALAPALVSAWRYLSEAEVFLAILANGNTRPLDRPEFAASIFTDEATLQGLGTSVSVALVAAVIALQALHRARSKAHWSATRILVTAAVLMGLIVAAFTDLAAERHSFREFSSMWVPANDEAYVLFRLRHANATLGALERTTQGAAPVLFGAVLTSFIALLVSLFGRGRQALWVWALTAQLAFIVSVRAYSDHFTRSPVYAGLRDIQARYEPGLVEAIAAKSAESP